MLLTLTARCIDGDAARAAAADSMQPLYGMYIDVKTGGEFTAQKTLQITGGMAIAFDNIPVGATLYVSADVYMLLPGGQKAVLFSGKSNTITVQEGQNTVNLPISTGGGVYVNTNGTFIMSGGTIESNRASYGKGVFFYSNGTFIMSGSAVVAADNPVELNSSQITVAGTLTGSTPVATIKTSAGTTILTGLASQYSKFAAVSTTGTSLTINSDGTAN